MKVIEVPIDQITIDHETQSRAATNSDTVAEYAEAWSSEADFPPVELFSDGGAYHVGDGVHRILSAEAAGVFSVPAHIHKGDRRAAAIYACGANKSHGLKRSNADKRKCVERMLKLEPEWADNRIAEHVGVVNHLVSSVREQLGTNPSCEVDVNPPTRVGKDGKRRAAPAPKPSKSDAPKAPASKPDPPKPKPVKNGQPVVSHKERDKAESLVGELIRLLCDLGVYQQVRDHLNAVAEVVKRV